MADGRIPHFTQVREQALARGDVNLARAMTADLARLGVKVGAPETTQAPEMPEKAVPPAPVRRGRPPGAE